MQLIFHYKDFDGLCAGKILQSKYPGAKMFPYHYDEPIPALDFKDDIIMADVTFHMAEMIAIGKFCRDNGKTLLLIDHHASFKEEFDKLQKDEQTFDYIYDTVAACEMVWEYCYPSVELPASIKFLSDYDAQKPEKRKGPYWYELIMPFQYGLRLYANDLASFPTLVTLRDDLWTERIIKEGNTVLAYEAKLNAKHCAEYAFECIFEDLRAICINSTKNSSDTLKSVWDESKYDIMIVFRFDGTEWHYSLYATRIDVKGIAKKFGGGGHPQSAGFKSKYLIVKQ